MRLLGIILVLDGLGVATATFVVGVTAKAELKSLVGLAAVVKRGEGQLIIVDKTVHLYAPEYIGTLPSPTGFWRFLTEY